MAEREQIRANIPSSPACGNWETLLTDALDGVLRPEDEAVFSSHMATCPECAALFEEARRGREWLEFLAPEPEVPAYLLDKILGETGKMDRGELIVAGGPTAGNVIAMPPVWQRPGFAARMRRFAEPRLMMTAAMAFFSIALTLSMVGSRFSITMADLRPASVRMVLEKRIMTASTPLIRYYDHLRFVYEVESRMRELRRSSETETEQRKQQPSQNKLQPGEGETHKKDGGSQLNPNEAPQQTVNPPVSLWSSDTLEARYEKPLGQQRRSRKAVDDHQGFPTLNGASGFLEAGLNQTDVLAMPERSNPCVA